MAVILVGFYCHVEAVSGLFLALLGMARLTVRVATSFGKTRVASLLSMQLIVAAGYSSNLHSFLFFPARAKFLGLDMEMAKWTCTLQVHKL